MVVHTVQNQASHSSPIRGSHCALQDIFDCIVVAVASHVDYNENAWDTLVEVAWLN